MALFALPLYFRTIPYAGNQFTQPCDCEVLTRVNAGEDPAEAIERVVEQMNRYPASRQLVQRLRPKSSKKSATAPLATAAAPAVQRKNVDWRTQQKDLDDMFDKQTKEQLENLPDLEMPSQLTNVTLFDYQVQGIKWLVHNETSTSLAPFYKQVRESGQIKWLCEITNCSQTHEPKRIRGGILADGEYVCTQLLLDCLTFLFSHPRFRSGLVEMGLGKSLQTIGLILCNPPEGHVYPNGNSVPLKGASEEDAMGNDDKEEDKKPAAAPTVTVLRKFPVKTLQLVLSKAGLVATGKKAELVESCQQGLASGTLTGDNFTSEVIDELANFVPPVFGGGSLAGPTPTANVATLIVCPVSVMSNWVHQIESHVKPGVLRVALYHGPDRHLLIPRIRNNEIDVLIVSYSTLAAEVPSDKKSGKENVQPPVAKKRKNKNGSILEETFYRVVLDEAQQIRTSKTRAFNAVASVKADRRLCLTGTPFVNKVGKW
jgi:SNF2 family DNA or RNA helicase